MAHNVPGCSNSELIESIRAKASAASKLLNSMGPEPSPPTGLFDRLVLALERRRAATSRELADWRHRRQQLQDAIWESGADLSNCTVYELCRLEAELDAAITSDRNAIRKGLWDSNDVNSRAAELIESLKIQWNVCNSDLRVGQCLAVEPSWTCAQLVKFDNVCPTIALSKSELKPVGTSPDCVEPACASAVVNEFRALVTTERIPVSGTLVSTSLFVLEVGSSKCISQFDLLGSKMGRLNVRDGDSDVKFNPYRIRCCPTRRWIIIVDQYHKQVLCTDLSGCLKLSVGLPKGHQLHDAISIGDQLIACCQNAAVFSISFESPSAIQQCKCNVQLFCPIRLAWCGDSETLLIVDRIQPSAYRIQGFDIADSSLKAKPYPGFVVYSRVIPCAVLNSNELIIAWCVGVNCVISRFPVSATSVRDELSRLSTTASDPTDMCWLPTGLLHNGKHEYGVIVCCRNKSVAIC